MNKIDKYFLILFLGIIYYNISFCQKRETDLPTDETYGSGSNVFIDFYQNILSPIKGGNTCPMHPSCSQYSKILFQTQPIHEAYIGTLERVLRCGHELYLYPKRKIEGRLKWYNPPIITLSKEIESYSELQAMQVFSETDPLPDSVKITVLNNRSDEQFAEYLYSQKEYYRAITEYMRLHFNTTDSLKEDEYLRKIGLCYYYDSNYDGYEQFLTDNRQSFNSNLLIKTEMELLLGKIYYYQQKYQKAISTFEWISIDNKHPLYNELQFCAGLSYVRLFQWENAIKYFDKVNPVSDRGNISKTLCDSLIKVHSLSTRQPWIAGTLSSVVPGAGYIYSDRTATGVASFLVNGLLFWAGYDAVKNESYGLASALGFFGMGWYIGNINGSVKAANEYNFNARNDFLDKLLNDIDLDKLHAK